MAECVCVCACTCAGVCPWCVLFLTVCVSEWVGECHTVMSFIHPADPAAVHSLTHSLSHCACARWLSEWSVWFGKIEKAFLPSFTPTPTNITPFMMTLAGWLAGWLVSE